jgi:hypothetical protein
MRTCGACGEEVKIFPLRGTQPPEYVTVNPAPSPVGQVVIERSMHGEDEAVIVATGAGRYRLHDETCPQRSLF